MNDAQRQPQLFSVSPLDGRITQLTRVSGGVLSAFSVSSDGQYVAFIAEGSVMLISTDGRQTRRLTFLVPPNPRHAPKPA